MHVSGSAQLRGRLRIPSRVLGSLLLAGILAVSYPMPAGAQAVTAPGYVHSYVTLGSTSQSCVAVASGGTFVGRGPGFTANAQAIVFVTESGGERIVATGFNSISDCAYDRDADVLYVTDNSLEAPGALTGDTVFAVPSASTATSLQAVGVELASAGSIASAASVAVSEISGVYVSDAAGGGAGSVRRFSGGSFVPFVGALDFAAGLAFEDAGTLLVAETLDTFQTRIVRYDVLGNALDVVAPPSYGRGSYDLAFGYDGRVLVTGAYDGPIVAVDTVTGVEEAVAEGFTYATALDVNPFTGRVELVSSSFAGETEDFRLHRLTPTAKLSPMGKVDEKNTRECLIELYGIRLAPNKKGNESNIARCYDGDACDGDATVNGACSFPLGVCLNVSDSRLPACVPLSTASFELEKAKPASPVVSELASTIDAALPVEAAQCFFTEGVTVPVRAGKKGALKPGKQFVKLKAKSLVPVRRTDVDVVKLVCVPAR